MVPPRPGAHWILLVLLIQPQAGKRKLERKTETPIRVMRGRTYLPASHVQGSLHQLEMAKAYPHQYDLQDSGFMIQFLQKKELTAHLRGDPKVAWGRAGVATYSCTLNPPSAHTEVSQIPEGAGEIKGYMSPLIPHTLPTHQKDWSCQFLKKARSFRRVSDIVFPQQPSLHARKEG